MFSTWTHDEYKGILGAIPPRDMNENVTFAEYEDPEPNDSVDWRNVAGKVQPVKNQHGCGSCWAFSAMGTVESAYAITYGKLYNLSE